jgi:hypothetical protein
MHNLLRSETYVADSPLQLPPLEDADPRDLGYWYRPSPTTPISMRLGHDLGWSVAERQFGRWSAARVMRRDLERYYAGVRRTLDRLALTRREAEIMIQVLHDPPENISGGRVLAATIEEWIEHRTLDPALKAVAADLMAKVRGLGPMECCGVIDGVEVFWAQRAALHTEDDEALLEWAFDVSGLTKEHDRQKSLPIMKKMFGFSEVDEADQVPDDE